MSKENSQISSNTNQEPSITDAAECPICHGVGYVRYDLPLGHPDFGKITLCSCQWPKERERAKKNWLDLGNLGAYRQYSFENFNPRGRVGIGSAQENSLKYALNLCQQFANHPKGWLLLSGAYGCGKTHLAAAIANQCLDAGVPTIFIVVPEMLDWLRSGFLDSDTPFDARFEQIRNIQLLILDDIGTQNATAWAQEKLYQLINHRYVNQLPTVLTTNQSLDEVEGRIRSRMVDSDLVMHYRIIAPDYRSAAAEDTSTPRISSLSLHYERTLGNFNTRENEKLPKSEQTSLIRAFHAARKFSEKPEGWLIFTGVHGCGKTHLAAAIANQRLSHGDAPVFVFVPDLLDHLRATFNPKSMVTFDTLFEEARSASLLILDGWGTQSSSPWAREKLYQIINHRYNAKLPTVITTTLKVEELEGGIQSRVLDGRLCDTYAILAPPYRVLPTK